MIIAIDPGGTTGVAIRHRDKETPLYGRARDKNGFEFLQLNKPSEVYDLLWKLTEPPTYYPNNLDTVEAIVCENFSTAGRISKDGLLTVRIIGGIQAIGWLRNIKVWTPEPAQRYMKKLEAEELAPKGHALRHQRDALMHLLAYEYRKANGGYN